MSCPYRLLTLFPQSSNTLHNIYKTNNDRPQKESQNLLEALHWQLQMSYYQIEYHFGFVGYVKMDCVGRLRVWSDQA